VKTSKTVIGQVDENAIRTYGENCIHASQIDYFVESTQEQWPGTSPEEKAYVKRLLAEPVPAYMEAIGRYIGMLVWDGDTFGIGAGEEAVR